MLKVGNKICWAVGCPDNKWEVRQGTITTLGDAHADVLCDNGDHCRLGVEELVRCYSPKEWTERGCA